MKMLAKYRKILLENGTQLRQFHAAAKSMRHCRSLIGVTVARLDTTSDPHWTNSNRWLGTLKSCCTGRIGTAGCAAQNRWSSSAVRRKTGSRVCTVRCLLKERAAPCE